MSDVILDAEFWVGVICGLLLSAVVLWATSLVLDVVDRRERGDE